MTEYQYHWWPSGAPKASLTPSIRLQADSHVHGAALALLQFKRLGCEITAPLAHVDISEPDGTKQTLLVEEVVNWLHEPEQIDFLRREGLDDLLR
jgi:hypothetical protein